MPPIAELEEIRKRQILEAAMAVIALQGVGHSTMAQIARAANLSKGGMAHYFKSKDELFKAAFHEFFDRAFERCRNAMDEVPDPLGKILAFVMLYDIDDPDVRVGYPLLGDCMALAARDDEYRDLFDSWVDRWIDLLTEAIDLGLEQGVFVGVDPEPMARIISAIYQGIAERWFLAPKSHDRDWAWEGVRTAVTALMKPHMKDPP